MLRFARRVRVAAPTTAATTAARRAALAVGVGTRAATAAAVAVARGAAAQRHMTTRSAKFPAQPPRPVHSAEVQAARDGASASAATSASGAAVSSSGSAAADAAGADDTQMKLQSEEIQKLLKVVDLYLAGGKQQRDAVLKALESEGGEDLRAAFLELVPRVVANRAFILDTLATNADVTQQPVVVARLLATDTKQHTPRQVLDGVLAPPVGRSAPVTSDWLQRLSTLDLNTTHDNDAWEFERAFEAVRKSAVSSFPELVALHEPAATRADAAAAADQLSFRVEAAATFVPFVAEKLHALALFGLKSLVVHSELKLAADDPCDSRARAKLHDAFRLPTVADLTEAYGLKADARRELNASVRRFPTAKVMQTLKALSRTDATAWHPSKIDEWLPRWDDCTAVVREVLRGPARSHEFHKYMSGSFQHDVLTAESVTALSHYVCARLLAYAPPPQVSAHRHARTSAPPPQPVTVLEIGAGNGRLTHFLRKFVDKTRRTAPDSVFGATANPTGARLPPTIKFVATDIAPAKSEVEKVEKLDAAAAVRKYNPQIVICQWMPPGVDLSAAIRRPHDPANASASGTTGPAATLPPATPSGVREYVLMGEADSGVCGDAWKTWGVTAPDALVWGDAHTAATAAAPLPPYAADGYRRVDLPELSAQQICKNDTFYGIGWSKVVAFRKEQQPTAAAAAAPK